MTFAKRTDSTHKEIVEAFRQTGWRVMQTYRLGQDNPDLVVSRRGRVVAVEVKSATGKVTAGQRDWLASWGSETAVVRCVADVLVLSLNG